MSLNFLEQYDEAVFHCEHAILVNEKSTKAHYIKSQAFQKQQEYDKAVNSLKEAIKLSPNDRKLRQDLEVLNKEKAKHNETFGQKISNYIKGGIYNEKESKIKKQKHKKVHKSLPEFNPENVQCYFDFQIGFDNEKEENKTRGRVVFELFDKDCPETCENFRVLCTGEKSAQLHYQNKRIHRIVKDFSIEGGDISAAMDGKGGKSIYGESDEPHTKDGLFRDENVWFPHTHLGVISMLTTEKDSNGSQWVISLKDKNFYFTEKNTLFGRIISGWDMIEKICANPRSDEKPIRPVIIHQCGELRFEEKLTKEQAEFLPNYSRNVYEEDEIRAKRRELKRQQMEKLQEEIAATKTELDIKEGEKAPEQQMQEALAKEQQELDAQKEAEKQKKIAEQIKRDQEETYVEEITD